MGGVGVEGGGWGLVGAVATKDPGIWRMKNEERESGRSDVCWLYVVSLYNIITPMSLS